MPDKRDDEITRLRAQVAVAYQDAAKVVWPDPLGRPRKPTKRDAPEYQAVYEAQRLAFLDAQEIRSRTPDDAAAALDALLQKAARPKVKSLQWVERRGDCYQAGPYQVCSNHNSGGMWRVKLHGRVILKRIRGLEKAQEWANKHHETRILSQLESPTQESRNV